jgi:hypothetical protein
MEFVKNPRLQLCPEAGHLPKERVENVHAPLLGIPLLVGHDVDAEAMLRPYGWFGETLLKVQAADRAAEKNRPFAVLRPRINAVPTIDESFSVRHRNVLRLTVNQLTSRSYIETCATDMQ